MTLYQTGELAKHCNVTVRTIQYYDKKGLLQSMPSSSNGRRLFDEQSKVNLEIILILKSIGFSLKDIKILLTDDKKLQAVKVMLHRKKTEINEEIEKLKLTAYQMKQLESSISEDAQAPIEKLINTHKYVIQNQRGMTLYMPLLYKLSPAIIIQYTSIIASVLLKKWMPFLSTLPILVIYAGIMTKAIYQRVSYLCPNCQQIFKPKLSTWMFAAHTPKTRKLQCPHCYQTHHCVTTLKTGSH
ncbi:MULTISPECIES: MerR family transcriptional regulator [unclassified Staphylococcus]|uniref:MerR family transcriptional regulator n=1 Tax=unclassified Staphylococcus TaxID=91994 RepID=UPI001AEC724E|nr:MULTISPECIES: MerR family transcriptional regulator [unclassified Staphylococcus]